VYWPLLEMDPAPALASPPLTLQLTDAAPPPLSVAVNCSIVWPVVLLVALQPVQLVSTVAAPGEMEKVLFEELFADPPQPESRMKIGTAPAANIRPGLPKSKLDPRPNLDPRLRKRLSARFPREVAPGFCGSVVAAASWLNLPGAFLANIPSQSLLDVARRFC
jgi:hypothetical protein